MKLIISRSPNKHFDDNERMDINVTSVLIAHYLVSLVFDMVLCCYVAFFPPQSTQKKYHTASPVRGCVMY